MKRGENLFLFLMLIVVSQSCNWALRTKAKTCEPLYHALTALDSVGFLWGSDASNLDNQFTWTYWRVLQEPRPWWHKALVWGPLPTEPKMPDYQYRPVFDHTFPPRFDKESM